MVAMVLISFRSPMRCVSSLQNEVTLALLSPVHLNAFAASIEKRPLNPLSPKLKGQPLSCQRTTRIISKSKNIIVRNFKLVQRDYETAPILKEPPLVSFKSLRNSLLKGSLASDLQLGTFRCSPKRCNTCPLDWRTQRLSTLTTNVIYCISCA